MTEIVVTGIGLISPAGLSLDASLSATFPLEPSEDTLTYPAHPGLPRVTPVAGHFSLKGIVKKRKTIKLMARANQFAVAATDEAITSAGLNASLLSNAGMFMAIGREPSDLSALLPSVMNSTVDQKLDLTALFTEGVNWINPLSSLKTLPNMSLAHAAIHVGLMGPNMALYGPDAFSKCVDAARRALENERCEIAFVGGADSCTSLFDRLALARECPADVAGEGAAMFILETRESASRRTAKIVAELDALYEDEDLLRFGYCGAATPAMSAAFNLGRLEHTEQIRITQESSRARARRSVVVSGVGVVSPLGDNFDQFGRALRSGVSAIAPITHFDASDFTVPNACEVKSTVWWDRLSPDLKQRLTRYDERSAGMAVSAAIDAVQDAGLGNLPRTIVYGTGLSSVSLRELEQDCIPYLMSTPPYLDARQLKVRKEGVDFVAPYRHRMNLPLDLLSEYAGYPLEQITHFSACAAGAAAIGHSLDLIRFGQQDRILVGAADAMIHPYGLIPFAKLGATSTVVDPAKAAMPFDRDRSGFVMGETAAFFVLEDEASAQARGAHIYARVLGWGSSCDAFNVTAPHPDGLGAQRSMIASLQDARITPKHIDYINAHGTGTQLNDTAEALAIHETFGAHQPWVSSSKSQLGHCIGAAGAIEFAVCISSLEGGFVPPNVSLRNPIGGLGTRLAPNQSINADVGCVMSNSFGFGGQNVSLILAKAGSATS